MTFFSSQKVSRPKIEPMTFGLNCLAYWATWADNKHTIHPDKGLGFDSRLGHLFTHLKKKFQHCVNKLACLLGTFGSHHVCLIYLLSSSLNSYRAKNCDLKLSYIYAKGISECMCKTRLILLKFLIQFFKILMLKICYLLQYILKLENKIFVNNDMIVNKWWK